jgi:hypothetical protein
MGEEIKVFKVLVESLKLTGQLEFRGVDGRVGSKGILGRLAGRM